LLRQLRERVRSHDKGLKLITFFTIPKPFKGHFDVIQRNAIKSWLSLRPSCEIFLFGNDPGVADVARELGVKHSADFACNNHGTPLINDVFEKAQRLASHKLLCYLNADIILLNDFLAAAQRVHFKRFLMAGCRWDIDVNHLLDFDRADCEAKLRELVAAGGALYPPEGIDVFLFTQGLWGCIPPFAVGRAMWDNWMIYQARAQRAKVIDATKAVTIIHQNHSYAHLKGGKQEAWEGPEAEQNRILAGGYKNAFTILDANWILTPQGLSRPKTPEHLQRRKKTWPVLHPRLHIVRESFPKGVTALISLISKLFYALARRARFFLSFFRPPA
jgi:hypothetical protein